MIEGAVLVREAIAAGVELEAIYVDVGHGALVAEFDQALPLDVTVPFDVVTVAEGVLGSVLSTVTPQPVCAVAPLGLARPLDDVVVAATEAGRPLLVLVDLGDPGNVGTLLRAAESSGCGGVMLAGAGVDLYSPKVVRASAGSMFRLPIAVEIDTDTALVAIAELGVPLVAAIARNGTPHLDAPLAGTVAIVLGNEAHGLSADLVDRCDDTVTITMDGPAESLNVAMAGTVLCFEALRQRNI